MSKEREEFEKRFQEIWDLAENRGEYYPIKHLTQFRLEVQKQHEDEVRRLQTQVPMPPHYKFQKDNFDWIYATAINDGIKRTIKNARTEREQDEIKKHGEVRPEVKREIEAFEKLIFPHDPEIQKTHQDSKSNDFRETKTEILPRQKAKREEVAERYGGRTNETPEPSKEDHELDRG